MKELSHQSIQSQSVVIERLSASTILFERSIVRENYSKYLRFGGVAPWDLTHFLFVVFLCVLVACGVPGVSFFVFEKGAPQIQQLFSPEIQKHFG